jgi:transcriptional regulator with XRE-family HTH domain
MDFSIQKTPTDLLKEIAKKHRTLRKQLKISQAELAERSGVSLGSLKRFENTGKISLEALLKLSNILGCLTDFEKIFNLEENLADIEQLFSDKTRKQ